MTSPDKQKPRSGDHEKMSPNTRRWRRALKVMLGLVLIVTLSGVAFVGALILRHHRIVSASPGSLQTQVQSLEIGRRVNPFIGTGGYP